MSFESHFCRKKHIFIADKQLIYQKLHAKAPNIRFTSEFVQCVSFELFYFQIMTLCSKNFQNVKLRLDFISLIILLPLRIYVKSNFGEFKRFKNVIFCHFWVLNFDFNKFKQLSSPKFTTIQGSESLKLAKITFLDCLNSPKFDFT